MRKSGMEQRTRAFIGYIIFLQLVQLCFACQMEGITNWLIRVDQSILDTHIGTFFDRSTSNIEGITNINYGGDLNRGPYIDVSYDNSRFTVGTNGNFAEYEEYETSRNMRVTVTFNCSPGSTDSSRSLVLVIDIIDTNNNAPRFLPSSNFEFTVIPPLPPGFLVTGCDNQIIARDIDLTTQRVDFTIDDNPYFEIFYDQQSDTTRKEFLATFRAKTFIRSISEPLSFTIRATDVDETNDPPLTSTATVRILADTQFQLPDELQFSRAFYTINYTAEHNLITDETILLTQGHDNLVKFDIEGQYSNNFEIRTVENQVIFEVKSPLTADILQENQIYIVLRAERENTIGATATIIIKLPAARELSFESSSYTGLIENNILEYGPILLNKGYKEDVVFNVRGDQADIFLVGNEQNQLLLSLNSQIPEEFLRTNNIIVLEVTAAGQSTNEASATVIFEIIKDDVITPIFTRKIYQGAYLNPSYVDIEDISLLQGYDETVQFQLFGEHANYFAINNDRENVIISLKSLIPENIIFSAKVFLLYIVATKPYTVGGNTALVIRFPTDLTEPHILRFSKNTYTGSLERNAVSIENMVLDVGFTEQVRFILIGDYSDYFTLSNNGNSLSIVPHDELFNQNFEDKSFLILNVLAERENAISVTSTVVINIVKEVRVQPVFNKAYYRGVYIENSLQFNDGITLVVGFDETVSFQLEGEFSQWFYITQNGNSITLNLNTTNMIPDEIMEKNRLILFTIVANKPYTLPERAVIAIELVQAKEENRLEFDRAYYIGSLDNKIVKVEPITLIGNYNITHFINLHGDMAEYFSISQKGAIVEIVLQRDLPEDYINNNRIITLEIRATKQDITVSHATVVLNIIRHDEEISIADSIRFSRAYYTGRYTSQNVLYFDEVISLAEGYDNAIQFELKGEFSQWFYIIQNENSVTLHEDKTNLLPNEIKDNYSQILFTIMAHKPNTVTREAVIAIELIREHLDSQLDFDRAYYIGSLTNSIVTLDPIILIGNYDDTYTFTLHGDLSDYFDISQQGDTITLILQRDVPEDYISNNEIITFEIRATKQDITVSHATIVLNIIRHEEEVSIADSIRFNRAYYTGHYTSQNVLYFDEVISLAEGYDNTIQFELEGEFSQWFYIIQNENSVTLHEDKTNLLPNEIKDNYNQILFTIMAHKPNTVTREAVIAIELIREHLDSQLDFDRAYYIGSLTNSIVTLDPIILIGNYDDTYTFTLHGDLSDYFDIAQQGDTITLILQRDVPEDYISNNEIITFEIRATKQNIRIASATIILKLLKKDDDEHNLLSMHFDRAYYTGRYTSDNVFSFKDKISLIEGYDETVRFVLEGEYAPLFQLQQSGNSAILTLTEPISSAIVNSQAQLIFIVRANRYSDETITKSTIVIIIDKGDNPTVLRFERQNYIGTIKDNTINLEPIVLIEGYSDMVSFSLHGELNSYFRMSVEQNVITIGLQRTIPEDVVPNNGVVTIDVRATASQALSGYTTIVLTISKSDASPEQSYKFDHPYYYGSYMENSGFIFDTAIALFEGYDETIEFTLDGEDSTWFEIRQSGNSATLYLSKSIPENILDSSTQLIFVVQAQKSEVILARSVIIIALLSDSSPEPGATFDKVLYRGRLENGVVNHETITILKHDGDIQLSGEYEQLFSASISNGIVFVEATSTTLPTSTSYIILKLKAAEANAVLLLDLILSDTPVDPPSLSFSSPSYVLQTDETQIGLVGRVSASADNGEAVTYSLGIQNEHLRQRVTINNGGEIHLSAAADVGSYSFQVSAITIISRVTASATVHLTVTEAEADTIPLPPLLILERNEEEPHRILVPLNSATYPNCQYRLTNRWPVDQNWLYVDQEGLHARSIDREHESIAFMPVSQIQVELNLYCDTQVRTKRWIRPDVQEFGLRTYDYGSNRWILSDTILYDPRRTLVNLIVNDINDNAPIFIGKDNEPITVGYPRGDIEEMVMPRALAELKATDADIGENAELRYWSSEEGIIVSPTTGSVHVRNRAILEDNTRLIINAADRKGTGLTGSLEILVRFLDRHQIAVITVTNVFLEDELKILHDLTQAVGYEIKSLRTTAVSESFGENNEEKLRTRRDLNTLGASLRLYVYGLRQREPINVSQLTSDLSNNNIVTVSLARVLSLEDHLEGLQICDVPEREIGLLAATIVLAVLLLIVTVTMAIWFYLKRKSSPSYDQFSDQNSLQSRNESIESPKVEAVFTTSKLNIDELRKSEKRLQERLDAPIENVNDSKEETVLPKNPQETVVELSEPESKWPIVIQSIDKLKDNADESDDDDEFGEKQRARRKSVVTFNENVEKIIHLEDRMDEESEPDVEVQKL